MVEAAPLERIVHLARAVGGDDDDGAFGGGHRAELGHAHLELGEHLQQVGLEGRIGPVDLVDQQHRGPKGIGLQRGEQRPLDQEALAEDVLRQGVAPGAAALGQANREHLCGVVPLVDGGGRIEPLVALQAQETAAQGLGKGRGELGLAAAGLAFQQQRAAEGETQVEGLDQRVVRDIAPLLEERPRLGFAARQRPHSVRHAPLLTRIGPGSKGGAAAVMPPRFHGQWSPCPAGRCPVACAPTRQRLRTGNEMTERYAKGFPVSWDQLHRDARALAWRLAELGPWRSIVAVTRGGLVPATVVARELDIRMIDTVCISSYDHQDQRSAQVLKPVAGDGEGVLIVDDLADTGATARIVREMLPKAHFACVYTKPAGRGEAHTFVTEVSQDTWIFFPWDTDLQFVPPIAEREAAGGERGAA